MDTKKAVLKGVLTMVVVALAGFLLFNGIGRHPYQPDELEGVFRKEAAARSVSGEGEVISETYGNSITFAMQTADGKRACATYGRSMFFDKYKELEFYTGVQGEEPAENIVYAERNDFLNDYIDSLAEELPAQRKKVFILSKRQNYTNKEIAEMMGISESTVATQLSLAVKFMREQLMKHYDKVIAFLIAFFVNEM